MPQPPDATLTRPLTKADGWLDWTRPAVVLERRVRAMWPWPRGWTTLDGAPLQVHAAAVAPNPDRLPPGRSAVVGDALLVGCGEDALVFLTVQPSGGRAMPGAAFAAGRPRLAAEPFGTTGAPAPPPPLIVGV